MTEQSMVENFWKKVAKGEPADCWLWLATSVSNGRNMRYGTIRWAGRTERAAGLVVRHKCDVSLCCNPAHLELGTQRDNVADRYIRGRANHVRGENHGNSKLTAAMVLEIRRRRAAGETLKALASQFNVSLYGIQNAVSYGWKHV